MAKKTIVVTVKTDVGQTMDFDLLRAAAVRICRRWNVQRIVVARTFVEFHVEADVTVGAPAGLVEDETTMGVMAAFAEAELMRETMDPTRKFAAEARQHGM